MTTAIHLVRHGSHAHVGHVLTGRMGGLGLTEDGRREAEGTAALLRHVGVESVLTSPRQRAVETGDIVALRTGCSVEVDDDLDEIDFGSWTGMPFPALNEDPSWRAWNAERSRNRPPGGETMQEAQVRIVRAIERIPGSCSVLVSHSDVIKAALMHYLGMPLDGWWRLEIAPASVSTVALRPSGSTVLRTNWQPS